MPITLRARAIVLLLLTASVTIFGAATVNYRLAERTISGELLKLASGSVSTQAYALSAWLDNRLAEVDVMSHTDRMRFGAHTERMAYLIREQERSAGVYLSMGIADTAGRLRTTDGSTIDISMEPSFERVMRGEHVISDPFPSRTRPGKWIVTLQAPLYDRFGNVTGLLNAAADADRVFAMHSSLKGGERSRLFLLNQEGKIIYERGVGVDPAAVSAEARHYAQALRNAAGDRTEEEPIETSYDGERSLLFTADVSVPGWTMATSEPVSRLYEPLERLMLRTAAVGIAAVIALCALLLALFRPIVRRLQRISRSIVEVAGGRFRIQPMETGAMDEIGVVADAVNRMVVQLRNLFEPLQAITNQNDYGIVVTDAKYVITQFNETAERMLGYAAEEVVGRATPLLFHDEEELKEKAKQLSRTFDRLVKPGIPLFREWIRDRMSYSDERMFVRKDGSRLPVFLNISRITDDNGGTIGYVGLFRDISRQQRIQNELMEAKLEAERANQAKSLFLARMSHEIRTPLNGIAGLSALLSRTALDDEQQDYVQKIASSSETVLGIINDILDLSKIEAGKIELERIPFSTDELFRKLSDMLAVLLGVKPLDIVFETDETVPRTLVGDPLRLEQVLLNLTGNAVKFTEQGLVHVRVQLLRRTPDEVSLAFSVKDTGIGIAADKLDQLFQPFTQADGSISRKYGGTGLGLVIAAHLVEAMGGQLKAESELGLGSCFSFTLKLGVAAEPADQGDAEDRLDLDVFCIVRPGVRQEALDRMLRSLGCRARYAPTWKEAILRLREEAGGPYDVVLFDVDMPDMYGNDSWRELRAVAGRANTVSVSSLYGQREWLRLPADERPDHALVKPLHRLALVQALTVARQCRRRSPAAAAAPPGPPLPDASPGPSTSARASVDAPASARAPADLPVTPSAPGNPPASAVGPALARVLIVDDQPINRTVASGLLREAGCETGEAASGAEALRLLAGGEWDLVLMDVQMPEMDGLETARRIRELPGCERLPIVASTADPFAARDCYAAGMCGVALKPLRADALLAEIRDGLAWAAHDRPLAWDEAVARLGGKTPMLEQLLQTFESEYADVAARLLERLRQGDTLAVRRLVHTLKGVSGHLAAHGVYAAALALEEALAEQPEPAGEERWRLPYEKLVHRLDLLLAEIRARMDLQT